MTSYEERVVDREIDTAWMTFRLRLAAWLDDEQDRFVGLTTVDACGEHSTVLVERRGGLLRVEASDADGTGASTLRALGFRPFQGALRLNLLGFDVDRAAHAVFVVLSEVRGLPHPSFAQVMPTTGEGLQLWDPPASCMRWPAPTPELLVNGSEERIRDVVHAALTQHIGSEPERNDADEYTLSSRSGGRAFVHFSHEDRIEVTAVLATEVRFKAAHREIDRLSLQFRHLRFYLRRDDLVVSTCLDTRVLVPAQLIDLVRRTLWVSGHLGADLDVALKRRRRDRPAVASVDPCLSVVASSSLEMGSDHLVDALVEAADGSFGRLESWLVVARKVRNEAWEDVREVHDGPLGFATQHHADQWRRTVQGLRQALRRVADERTGREAS